MSTDTKSKTPATEPSKSIITCDLHNPTPGRRIIFDGIEGSQKSIVVEAGDTKRGVTLHRSIAEELRDRNRAKKGSDLVIKPMSSETEDEKAA
jgi:hypothetical protein